MSDFKNHPDFVNSLARGLTVLGSFEKGREKMTLTEVASRTGLSRGTARRFLLTLHALGYLATDEKYYWLTHKVLRFGSSYLATFGLGEAALTHIRALTEQLEETSSMAILDEADIVYVARVEKQRIYSNLIEIGTHLPAHATSMGLVLLAALQEEEFEKWLTRHDLKKYTSNTVTDIKQFKAKIQQVREQGYAFNDGALELGVRSLSVPIYRRDDGVIAALNIATFASRMTGEEMISNYLPTMLETAKKIQFELQA